MNKKYKCPFCKKVYFDKGGLMTHMGNVHNEEMHNLPPEQIYFNYTNRYALTKEHGISVMSGKPTRFNVLTCRYERFADEKDREAYIKMTRSRMKKVHGVESLMNFPNHQGKMLGNRSISGDYKWADGSITKYTGSYERKFLEYLEMIGWDNPKDIMGPAPQVYYYTDSEGVKRFHMPDFYITSLNLIVNVKSSENKHYRLRDIENEKAQDIEIAKSSYNYLKLYDNKFKDFNKIIEEIDKAKDSKTKVIQY